MSRRVRVHGQQRKEFELERLAHALLAAAREVAEQEAAKAKKAKERRHVA